MALRNYIHRRNHKERSQPTHRKKFGLLEKHKDYVQRARDHHSKRDRIKRLREKALDRNKDEFYFGMVKGRTERGVHIQDRGNEALSSSIVSLMKTQDAAYVRRQITAEKKRIGSLLADLAPNVPQMRVEWLEEKPSRLETLKACDLLANPPSRSKGKGKGRVVDLSEDRGDGKVGTQGKRTVWVDGVDEVRTYSAAGPSTLQAPTQKRSLEDYDLDDLDDDVLLNEGDIDLDDSDSDSESDDDEPTSRRSQSTQADNESDKQTEADTARRRRRAERHWSYLLSLLRARQKRLEALQTAADRLGIVRALMANKGGGSVRKISDQKQAIADAVARGKMTKNGLALPGNEESDEEEEGANGRKAKVVFKWGKERKR